VPELAFNTQFEARTGEPVEVAEGVVRISAPNPGPFTFTGTNSFLIGDRELFVLDAGPAGARHRGALLGAIAGRRVKAILLTHTHRDHCGGARLLAAATGAPIWFGGQPKLRRRPLPFERIVLGRETDRRLRPDRVLGDGDSLDADGLSLTALATPGHAANHFAFALAGTPVVFTGDHVMGWNPTVVAPHHGNMTDYLGSLRKLIALGPRRYLPAHGGPIEDGQAFARALLDHRERRNEQIAAAIEGGVATMEGLLAAIYPSVAPAVRPAAELTLQAHLEYLAERGAVVVEPGAAGVRILPGPRGSTGSP
jgi:glyoxylase-like metal-dependent hydrolase (beta-lactamase superfamily II)